MGSREDVSFLILLALLRAQEATVYDLWEPIGRLTRHSSPWYGALYKAMHRLHKQGLVEKVGEPISEGGRPYKQRWKVSRAGIDVLFLELEERKKQAELLGALLIPYKDSHP